MGSGPDHQADPSAPEAILLLRRLGDLWVAYIKGQLLLSVITGGLTWVIGAAIGLPGSLWLGLLAGILNTIPNLGPVVAVIPAAVVAFWRGSSLIAVDNWAFALIVIGLYVLIQQVTALVIEPHLMGRRLDLPPLVVLIAVVAGAVVGNVAGAYLAVPLVATMREIGRFACNKVRGRPPFPGTRGGTR